MAQPNPHGPPRLADSETFRKLFWPAVWLGLFLLAFVTWRMYWKAQLENEKDIVRAAGYPADLDELNAWYGKPAGANAADAWEKAQKAWVRDQDLEDWMPRLTTQADAARMYADQWRLGLRYPEDVLGGIRAYWKKNEVSWQLMREAGGIEGCRWNVDYTRGFAAALPHLGEQRRMANYLVERMRLAGRDQDWNGLLETESVGFKLGRDAGSGPLLSGLVSMTMDGQTLKSIGDELPFLPPDGVRLKALQEDMSAERRRVEPLLADAFRAEAAMMLGEPHLAKRVEESWGSVSAPSLRSRAAAAAWSLLGGVEHDRTKIARHERQLAEAFRLPNAKRLDEIKRLDGRWLLSLRPWELACKDMAQLPSYAINHLCLLAHFDAAITAVAVERYRLDHGRLPAALGDLVPAYLPAVPGDAFDHGKPLRFLAGEDRFTVYSVGRNGADEGGEDRDGVAKGDDIPFTILLPNAPRGIVPKRKDLPEAGK